MAQIGRTSSVVLPVEHILKKKSSDLIWMTSKVKISLQTSYKGGFRLSCRLEIWPKFADDLVNLSFKSCRNGEFGKAGDGDFAI